MRRRTSSLEMRSIVTHGLYLSAFETGCNKALYKFTFYFYFTLMSADVVSDVVLCICRRVMDRQTEACC